MASAVASLCLAANLGCRERYLRIEWHDAAHLRESHDLIGLVLTDFADRPFGQFELHDRRNEPAFARWHRGLQGLAGRRRDQPFDPGRRIRQVASDPVFAIAIVLRFCPFRDPRGRPVREPARAALLRPLGNERELLAGLPLASLRTALGMEIWNFDERVAVSHGHTCFDRSRVGKNLLCIDLPRKRLQPRQPSSLATLAVSESCCGLYGL